jgi:cytochrome c oxidase assembly factor CtaG
LSLILSGVVYLRGWLALRRRHAEHWPTAQAAAFLAGLAAFHLALASPIELFASFLLSVHMVQHLLLMMVAPALIWFGAPLLPMVRGLPRSLRRHWIAPFLRSNLLRRVGQRATHPICALPVFVAVTWCWHIPVMYELALRSSGWHYVEHACFLAAALLFWYPVVRPYPSRPSWSAWLLIPYLILADVQNTILSAVLTFSKLVLYPYYEQVPRLAGTSALEDQATAGAIMWVPGSVAFLLPLVWIGMQTLYGKKQSGMRNGEFGMKTGERLAPACRYVPLTVLTAGKVRGAPASQCKPAYDLLHLPIIGSFLRWRHARLSLQLLAVIVAAAVIYDGFAGPQMAPMNLAGVLPWIHWRGLLMLGLLALGNVFCLACPFTLPRRLASRWLPPGRAWPRPLRNKWLAVVLLIVFLWSYEAHSLWDRPAWTAAITMGYFLAAFAVDGLFRGASFCKYVCPIGQFNFVQSLVSPWQVRVRQPAACDTCHTRDCIRGRESHPGCQLDLFQPRKSGNMDCTFCLDCVQACPHDNVGILWSAAGQDLATDPFRSGVGRFSQRPDLAVLVAVLVFGAFANAAGMVAPVVAWFERLQVAGQFRSSQPIVAGYYVLMLIVLPALLIAAAAVSGRGWGRLNAPRSQLAIRFCFTLVPLGFAMWLAHYSFHLFTSYDVVVPATQRFLAGWGWSGLGEPQWIASCCRPPADWLPRLEMVCLGVGFLVSCHAAYRLASEQAASPGLAARAFAPWGLLNLALYAAGIWIVCQPMQMRGTLTGGG